MAMLICSDQHAGANVIRDPPVWDVTDYAKYRAVYRENEA
jgi:hypothetical protein